MATLDIVFPERIAANMQGGPRFLTTKAYSRNGRRSINRDALYPIHEYTLAHPIRPGEGFEELRAFFYVVGGDEHEFLFKDPSDYIATPENTSLSLISGSNYQLNRVYSFGSQVFVRPIYKPRAGAVITRTRSGVTSIATATVSATTGVAAISGHVSGDTYTWSGQFYVPVAFKDAAAVWTVVGTSQGLTEWQGIVIEEVRL